MEISKIEVKRYPKNNGHQSYMQNVLELTIENNVVSFNLDSNMTNDEIFNELKKLDTSTLSVAANVSNIIEI